MREFVTAIAVKETEGENKDGWIDFPVVEVDADGKEVNRVQCRAKRPTPGQVAYLTASVHKRAALEQQIAGAINFCMAIMDQETSAYLSDRLLDMDDPFELPQLQEIIEALIEEWSARPTEQSSDSSPSPDATGPTSTTALTTSST